MQGVSPAPKHGPQNAVLMIAPASIRSAIRPFLTRSINTGWEEGYTASENSPSPQLFPFNAWAASTTLVKLPPAQPAIIPCCTLKRPFSILSVSVNGALPPLTFSASFSTLLKISPRFAFNSSISYVLLGWNGRAIIGLMVLKST